MTSILNRSVGWQLSAIAATWPRNDNSELFLLEPPSIGEVCRVFVDERAARIGPNLQLGFVSASSHLNGLGYADDDLEQIRIYTGVFRQLGRTFKNKWESEPTMREAWFVIESAHSLTTVKAMELINISEANWGDEFLSGEYWINVQRIRDYIICEWDSEGYAGERCVLSEAAGQLEAQYLSGWFPGDIDWVRGGRMRVPPKFASRLRTRIAAMGKSESWSGDRL